MGRELAAQGAHWIDLLPALGAVDGVLIPPDPRRASNEQLELHQRVGRELAAQGAHWIDLLPALGAVDGYFDHDAHFNPEGNAIAAQGIFQALVELGSILPDAGG